MKKIVWEVEALAPPPIFKYCKKCGQKREFLCSGQFRVNAQRRTLDVWLIYKCACCDTTWNATVYSRISPQALPLDVLEGFHSNAQELVLQYGMDTVFLRQNGAEVRAPAYTVSGECFSLGEAAEVELKSRYPLPIKVSAILRERLGLSNKEYLQLVAEEKIKSIPRQDLKNCRLKSGIRLIFQP